MCIKYLKLVWFFIVKKLCSIIYCKCKWFRVFVVEKNVGKNNSIVVVFKLNKFIFIGFF